MAMGVEMGVKYFGELAGATNFLKSVFDVLPKNKPLLWHDCSMGGCKRYSHIQGGGCDYFLHV